MKDVTYSEYLGLDKVLNAQFPRSEGEHDEMLFIIIHQVFELWFKQLLHEMTLLTKSLEKGDSFQATATLGRCLTILKTMVSQIDILETMTPVSFNSFRDRLTSSSGFQSAQFRQFEFLLGIKRKEMIAIHEKDPAAVKLLTDTFNSPSFCDYFYKYLVAKGYQVPKALLERDVTEPATSCPELHPILIKIYREDPLTRQICELLVDMDEGIQEWRYRHVKMVERTIGNKTGTGGSSGVEFLKRSLFKPVFSDLWEIRSEL